MQRSKSAPGMEALSSYRWTILGVAFTSQLAGTLVQSLIPPLAPIIQADLGLTKAEIGLFSSAALAGAWGVLLLAGYWTETVGVRTMLSIGQVIGGCLLLAMALTGSFVQALLVILAAGLCRGLTEPGATKAIVDWFPARGIATAMGIKQTGNPVGAMLMATILPALALTLGWRSAIAFMGILVVAGGIVSLTLYRNPPKDGATPRQQVRLLDGMSQLMANRSLWVISAVAIMFAATQLSMVSYFALYFSEVVLPAALPEQGARAVMAGGFLALVQAGGIVGRLLWGVISDRLVSGRRLPVIAAVGVLAALMALVLAYGSSSLPLWVLGMVAFACGMTGLGWSGLWMAGTAELAGSRLFAMGAGFSMTLAHLGVVGGPPLFGFVVDLSGSYQPAWLMLACFSMAGAVLAVGGERRMRSQG